MVKPIKIEIQLFASCCFSLFRKAGTILVHLEWCMIWSTMIFPQMIKHGRYTIVLISFNEIQSNSITNKCLQDYHFKKIVTHSLDCHVQQSQSTNIFLPICMVLMSIVLVEMTSQVPLWQNSHFFYYYYSLWSVVETVAF